MIFMAKIKFEFNQDFSISHQVEEKVNLLDKKIPVFAEHKENLDKIQETLDDFADLENLIVVGNGGSITSFNAYLFNLGTQKKVAVLNTPDPNYISQLKENFAEDDTLVMAISKSGETLETFSCLMPFIDYSVVGVTSQNNNALHQLCKKKDFPVIEHANIGGRFSAFTASALAPAMFCEMDANTLQKSAQQAYSNYAPSKSIDKNDALKLASYFYGLEQKGFTEIFCPIYSYNLSGFLPLVRQLVHETYGKNGIGQSLHGDIAPESQHHTNQRIFGGRKNLILWPFVVEKHPEELKVEIPKEIFDIKLRDMPLSNLQNKSYTKLMQYFYLGVKNTAKENKIPFVVSDFEDISTESIAEFTAFLHYFAYYSALLRNANPFDQPAVERSKELTFSFLNKK
ncbi:MAG: hypothetical protein COT15_02470 [Candidatus Diapherotrites archaeon CG08_land_8_20_14_0_20_34_12]|nr:MAG: hypothetical protein COT15_02470 [Candidatus Diapherotrites archaeon CG08_land_8_20_14_0_20_34_12]